MSSGTYPASGTNPGRGGTFGFRPRGRIAIVVVALAVLAVAAGVLIGNAGSRHAGLRARNATYGGYPSWLPHTKLPPVNDVLQSNTTHPKLFAIEGNTIEVHMAHAAAVITAVGPAFSAAVSGAAQAGTLPEGGVVPTTFTVTVIAEHGTVPLRASEFSILTSAGQLIHPALTATGGKPAPAALGAGQHVNLTLSVKLAEGDGSLRWAPSGERVLAGWLYQLELD
jgi:hypothetical protein